MKLLTPYLALLLAIAVPSTALGQPRAIANLSEGALLGQITNTAALQSDFAAQRTLLAQATDKLGLTRNDFNEVSNEIAAGQARYVEIPRHLDGMAGQHDGHVFAVHDILIPPHIHGWEVDLEHTNQTIRVFIPNRCGNISYLVARKHSIVATTYRFAAPVATPVPVATPSAPPFAPEATPVPAETPAPVALTPVAPAPAPAPAAHHFAVLPWLALGIIGLTLAHGAPSITLPHHHCGCEHHRP